MASSSYSLKTLLPSSATSLPTALPTSNTHHDRNFLAQSVPKIKNRFFSSKILDMESDNSGPSCPKFQELHVYEINEKDRFSKNSVNSLDDIIRASNELYTGDLKILVGTVSGLRILIDHKSENHNSDRYFATYSFNFLNYGHISVQGSFSTCGDSNLIVTGGSGIFEEVYGEVPGSCISHYMLFYTFYLKGIKDLPDELYVKQVAPQSLANDTGGGAANGSTGRPWWSAASAPRGASNGYTGSPGPSTTNADPNYMMSDPLPLYLTVYD